MSDRDRFRELDRLFQAVCDLPPSEREARLIELAPGDEAARSEVLELLRAESRAESGSGLSATSIRGQLADALADDRSDPTELAGYRVIRRLGAGGMGVVYEAEQQSPRRRVALKVLRAGLVSPELVRRFEFEVESLARLRHPGIAQIYEASVAEGEGGPRPFFAMELIHGSSLDRWAERVTPRERIAMVAEIADAVQHAHSRGVVHRDLKPANILVTDDGLPKVLDFGVARAADPEAADVSMHTSAGQLVGTLPYMSPELVRGAPEEIDTRADVYALGVILFELLTGRHPIDVAGMGVGEAAGAIEHTSPTRLATLEPRHRGDVDVIVQTALAKDKERRYATASALADDIRRYLDGQTIAARPASAVYQLSRLAKRHKPAVAAIAAAALAIVAATLITAVALVREQQTSDRLLAENANFAAINDFLRDMLVKANADEAGGDISLLDVLDSAAAEVETGSVGTAEVEASLRATLGSTLGWLGHTDRAVALLEPALAINRDLHGELHERTLTTLHLLARFQAREGDAEVALELLGDTPDRFAEVAGDDRDELELLGDLYRVQAIALKRAGRNDEVEPVLERAADVFERLRLPDRTYEAGALGEVYNELGTLRRHQGRLDESRESYERSLDIYAQVHGEDSERYSTVLNNLAILHRTEGDYTGAVELMRRSVEISEAIYGDSSPGPLMVKLANLGNMQARLGRYKDAEPVLRRALAYHLEVLPADHPNLAFPRTYLADVCAELGMGEEAIGLAMSAADTMTARFGPDSPHAMTASLVLGKAAATNGAPEQARAAFDTAINAAEASFGADSTDRRVAAFTAAGAMLRCDAIDEAERYLSTAGEPTDDFEAFARLVQGRIAFARGQTQPSLEALDAWWLQASQASDLRFSTETHEAARARAALLVAAGRSEDAERCREWNHAQSSLSFGADHARTLATATDGPGR